MPGTAMSDRSAFKATGEKLKKIINYNKTLNF